MFTLESHWVWDSWVVDDGETYHLFFLHAPRALIDPALRHAAATVGHATSSDLRDWTFIGETFGPSVDGWDDLAIWTGSVVRGDDGQWHFFYTALGTRGGHGLRDQRIGHAVSDDLHHWRRLEARPAVEVDPRWYATLPEDRTASETWRDPFVFRDPHGDGWHMLITARVGNGSRNDDGVVGHARSDDLRGWTVGPPLCAPGAGFGQLEVLQARMVGRRPVLMFTCHPQEMTADRVARTGRYCTWSVPGESLTGPWQIERARPFVAEPQLFAAPLVATRDGGWVLLGFSNQELEGVHDFDIGDPIPVRLDRSGAVARVETVG